MLFAGYGTEEGVTVTEEDRELLKKSRKFYAKVINEEDIGSDESIPDTDDDDEQDFEEIKDPRQVYMHISICLFCFFCFFHFVMICVKSIMQAHDADAVNKVLEELIQSPASKKICDDHHLDPQILTKVLGNLKDSIAQETLNQLTV